MSYNDDNDELDSKLRDDASWEPKLDAMIEREKREEAKQRGLDAIEAAGALEDDLADEEDEDHDDHGIAPELAITDADLDEMARRDELNKPAGLTFADACAILGHPIPRPGLAEARQTAGVRCKDLR